jgi:tetratricopeptide (TPR) repeat protein
MEMDLENIENLIREGASNKAQTLLMELVGHRQQQPIPRSVLTETAALCRRSGWPEGGLLLLNPVVRPPAATANVQATGGELVEYAASMNQVGRTQEALTLLASVKASLPTKFLTAAVASFSIWDYQNAILNLRRCLEIGTMSPYQRLIAGVNLAHALVYSREHDEAAPLLRTLRAECRQGGHSLLLGNLFEITAHAELLQGRYSKAAEWLEFAHELLKNHTSVDRIYIAKWQAVLRLKKDGYNKETRVEFHRLITLAQHLKHWETWRDSHFHLAMHEGQSFKDYLYCGTPHSAFRKRIIEDLGYTPNRNDYVWKIGKGKTKLWRLHVEEGVLSPAIHRLKPGQVLQRLFRTLTFDFYRPMTVPILFTGIFPDRYYDPVTSPSVVHQALKRLRQWLKEAKVPMHIVEFKGGYWLHSESRMEIQIPFDHTSEVSRRLQELKKVTEANDSQSFSKQDLCKRWQISSRAANYKIRALLEAGVIIKIGNGPSIQYRLALHATKHKELSLK